MKKAQSGMNAAVLIAIIAALIILYIIFLPSDEREELIGENESTSDNGDEDATILLSEKELVMEHIENDEIEHDLPSVNLYTSTEAKTIREETSVYVKSSLFDKQEKTINFGVKDIENVKNPIISFNAKKREGILTITLNENEVFSSKVDTYNPEPIAIPEDALKESNELKISVSGVGIAFWRTNEYLLEDFKISADVTDTTKKESELTFIIPKSEFDNIEEAELRFVPECQPSKVEKLEVSLNGNEVYFSIPDCGTPMPLDISPSDLVKGENKLVFKTEKGRYLMDQIKLTTTMKETPSYTFYFDLDKEDYDDIKDNNKKINLTFYFVDDISDKEAEILINDGKLFMTRHHKFEWSANIKNYVESGSNSLKVLPEEKLEIRKLQVKLKDI
jgi:hypothetical protein